VDRQRKINLRNKGEIDIKTIRGRNLKMQKVNRKMKNLNIAGRRKRKTYQTFNS